MRLKTEKNHYQVRMHMERQIWVHVKVWAINCISFYVSHTIIRFLYVFTQAHEWNIITIHDFYRRCCQGTAPISYIFVNMVVKKISQYINNNMVFLWRYMHFTVYIMSDSNVREQVFLVHYDNSFVFSTAWKFLLRVNWWEKSARLFHERFLDTEI